MKNKNLYDKTVSILVKAYLNNTLQHRICSACAVGNIINEYMPFNSKTKELLNTHQGGWSTVFTTWSGAKQICHPEKYKGLAKKQIDSTGYTWEELARVEFAFEAAKEGCSDEEYMFNGLMAVVEVLGEIHEVSQQVTEETKLMFVK